MFDDTLPALAGLLTTSPTSPFSRLRPYQCELLRKIPRRPSTRTLMRLECSGGKTHIAVSWAMLSNPTRERPLWFVVHRVELFKQARDHFLEAGFDAGSICAGEDPDPSAAVQIVTVQTLLWRDLAAYHPPAYIILDEAHHAPAASWQSLLAKYPNAEVLGLTATPCRRDAKPLGRFFDRLVEGPDMRWLINAGYLSDYTM